MASVSGSKLAFFAPGVTGDKVNVVLTSDGTNVGPTVAGSFNIEVFTSTAGALAPGFQGSAFVQGAVSLTNNLIQAATLSSTEQLLSGNYIVIDQTGSEAIQIVGSGAGGNSLTVVGSAGDTVTGSAVATNTQLIDASGVNPSAVKGAVTVTGGAGNTTVWAGTGDKITGGAGAMTVAGNGEASLGGAINVKVTGAAGNLTMFNLGHGDSVTGSTSGWTFVDDNYPNGGGNTIVGGAGNGTVTTPLGTTVAAGTYIIGGTGDAIAGGSGTMLVNALKGGMSVTGGGGASTVWGATGDLITAGTGFMEVAGGGSTIIGGASGTSMLVIDGAKDSVKAGAGATSVIGGANDTVTGGAGFLQFSAGTGTALTGGAGSVFAANLFTGNSIVGSTGSTTFMDDSYTDPANPSKFTGGTNTLVGGAGASTIIGGPGDSVVGGAGALEALFRNNLTGSETVDLSTGIGAAGVRDVSIAGGVGSKITVTGFATAGDKIESSQSVDGTGKFVGTSTVVGGNTTLTFVDGTTMTLLGVSDPTKISFTQ
jgi:hypothetical protein